MSKKGIFSIASGGSKDTPSSEVNDEVASPFSTSGQESDSDSIEASPFASDDQSGGSADEPFKMDGFGQDNAGGSESGDSVIDSPFKAVADSPDDYEEAKAKLEPQQDFAAVPAPFMPAVASLGEDLEIPTSEDEPSPAADAEITSNSQTMTNQESETSPAAPIAQSTQSTSAGMQQLEIRAIFGVDHILDANEIIQKARNLSGIGTVATVGGQEKQALSEFRSAITSLGLGDPEHMELNFGSGSVDFITEGETTLAVLQQGPYAPGVKETLIIVARELNKLA
ncbi:MAG: hypothetical protein P8P36_00425 [Akkermansiaceae bacterium]|nr:hypothetical protein [Akkermansiaceae bacterium]